MDIEKLREKLEEIRDFGHAEDCTCGAPVYECCCWEKDQSELAEEALQILEELDDDQLPSMGELLGM